MIGKLLAIIIVGLRPLLGHAACRFPLTCTRFAYTQLTNKPLLTALQAIIKRLLVCHPFSRSNNQ